MANQLKLSTGTSGMTVYAVAFNPAAQFWNTSGTPAFEAENDAHWSSYAINLTESGTTAIYVGSFPAGVTTAGVYYAQFRQRSGASPALTDIVLATGEIFWTGSGESFPLATSDPSATNQAFSNGNLNANIAQIGGVNASGIVVNDAHGNNVFSSAALENGAGSGSVNVTSWNGTPVTITGGLPSVSAANVSGTGTGPIAINQNTGGTDNLRYIDGTGNGVEGANILIYLATDWPSQPNEVQAIATTGPDGRWLMPAYVESGTYVAVFNKIGADGPDVSPAFSV